MPSKRGKVSQVVRSASEISYVERLPLELIDQHERNYRRHPMQQRVRICASLARFGVVRAIVVQAREGGRYRAVAGHGVVLAAQMIASGEYAVSDARRAQLATLPARVIPADWSDDDILAYLVADNLIAAGSEDDQVELANILHEQSAAGYELEALGSSEEELDALIADLADAELGEDDDEDAPAKPKRGTELKEPQGGDVEQQLAVLVECEDEGEQQRAFELLSAHGFSARVLTL